MDVQVDQIRKTNINAALKDPKINKKMYLFSVTIYNSVGGGGKHI